MLTVHSYRKPYMESMYKYSIGPKYNLRGSYIKSNRSKTIAARTVGNKRRFSAKPGKSKKFKESTKVLMKNLIDSLNPIYQRRVLGFPAAQYYSQNALSAISLTNDVEFRGGYAVEGGFTMEMLHGVVHQLLDANNLNNCTAYVRDQFNLVTTLAGQNTSYSADMEPTVDPFSSGMAKGKFYIRDMNTKYHITNTCPKTIKIAIWEYTPRRTAQMTSQHTALQLLRQDHSGVINGDSSSSEQGLGSGSSGFPSQPGSTQFSWPSNSPRCNANHKKLATTYKELGPGEEFVYTVSTGSYMYDFAKVGLNELGGGIPTVLAGFTKGVIIHMISEVGRTRVDTTFPNGINTDNILTSFGEFDGVGVAAFSFSLWQEQYTHVRQMPYARLPKTIVQIDERDNDGTAEFVVNEDDANVLVDAQAGDSTLTTEVR